MAVIVYRTHQIARTFVNEVTVTPDLEDGSGPVAIAASQDGQGDVVFDPTPLDPNVVSRCVGADGREAQSYPWTDVDEDWLQAQIDGLIDAGVIADGDVTLISGVDAGLPADWQWATSD
jgi:hypothetical protein